MTHNNEIVGATKLGLALEIKAKVEAHEAAEVEASQLRGALAAAEARAAMLRAERNSLVETYSILGYDGDHWANVARMATRRWYVIEGEASEVSAMLKDADPDFEKLLFEEAEIERSVQDRTGDLRDRQTRSYILPGDDIDDYNDSDYDDPDQWY